MPRKTRDGSEIVLGTVMTEPGYGLFLTNFINLDTKRKAPEILKISKKQIKRTSEYARAGNYKATAYCYRYDIVHFQKRGILGFFNFYFSMTIVL